MTPAWVAFRHRCPTRGLDHPASHRAAGDGSSKLDRCLSQPAAVRDYLRLKLVAEPNEIFAAVFLDSLHQVLAYEPLFGGTINATSVYPRVVVQRVLELNAAAVVFAHQHPSGVSEPSSADRMLTQQLQARAGAHRCAGTGPHHRRPGCPVLLCGIRPAVAMAPAPLIHAEASASAFHWRKTNRYAGSPRCALFVGAAWRSAFDYGP